MKPIAAIFALLAHVAVARAAAVSVRVEPPSWQARALAAALEADLAEPELRADVHVRGELAGGELRYAIESRGVVARGALAWIGLDRRGLAAALRDEVHRLVRPHEAPDPPAELAAPELGGGALAGLGVLAALLAVPLVLARTPRAAIGLAGALAAGGALVAIGERAPALVSCAGGLAWGAFAAAIAPAALPPLPGLHRVEHGELVPALAAWLAAAVQRCAVIALAVAGAGAALAAYAEAIDLPAAIAFGVVAPVAGLASWRAWRAVVERVARRLDRELVDGEATAAQPWHAQVRAYYVGYRRRANLDVDDQLLARVVFLPGRGADVAVYGDGFVRVVIPRAMLEHALAPYGRPHDYQMPRVSTLHWTHWNQGLVMPTEPGAKLATQQDRRPSATVDDGGQHDRVALGEPPTLSGIIEPQAFDPRRSYRPDEDPLWLDWDPGEEYDGTDAGDKDYLFGVLVHALGAVQRHEVGALTLARAWPPLRRFATRQAAALGDVHATLGGARHHLAQYLAWQLWHREDLVTARAYVPVLEQTSRAIAAALAADIDAEPAVARRIDRLRIAARSAPRTRRLALAVAALAVLGVALALVVEAVAYHATYEDRMETRHGR